MRDGKLSELALDVSHILCYDAAMQTFRGLSRHCFETIHLVFQFRKSEALL